jgi:predicted component of type VI protein secretion system
MNPGGITSAMRPRRSFSFISHPAGKLVLTLFGALLAGFALSGCTSIGINTAPSDSIRQKVRWTFEKKAVTIHVSADPDLNESDRHAHTLIIGIAQIQDPNGFLPLVQNPDRAMETLAGGKKRAGILSVSRFVVPPGADGKIVLDRMRNAMYIGIITGYSDYAPGKDIRIRPMPVRVRRSGIIFRSNHFRPALVLIHLVLGKRHLSAIEVLDTTKKKKHPAKKSPAKIPSAIRPI